MMHILRGCGLALVTGSDLPFFVDLTGLNADIGAEVHVNLIRNTIFSGRRGVLMTMRWDEGDIAIFFVYYAELHLGTLGIRRIQRAWRAHRTYHRRLALCMASIPRLCADSYLQRMLHVLCAQDLMALVPEGLDHLLLQRDLDASRCGQPVVGQVHV